MLEEPCWSYCSSNSFGQSGSNDLLFSFSLLQLMEMVMHLFSQQLDKCNERSDKKDQECERKLLQLDASLMRIFDHYCHTFAIVIQCALFGVLWNLFYCKKCVIYRAGYILIQHYNRSNIQLYVVLLPSSSQIEQGPTRGNKEICMFNKWQTDKFK